MPTKQDNDEERATRVERFVEEYRRKEQALYDRALAQTTQHPPDKPKRSWRDSIERLADIQIS
jgi:hypothetical protein